MLEFKKKIHNKDHFLCSFFIKPCHINLLVNIGTVQHQDYALSNQVTKDGANLREPIGTTIAALAELEPTTNMMDEIYKLRIQVTEVVSGADWWYMNCKECWKKLKEEKSSRTKVCSFSVLLATG